MNLPAQGKRQRRCLWRFTLTSPPGYPDHRLTLSRRPINPRIAPPLFFCVSADAGSSACAVSPSRWTSGTELRVAPLLRTPDPIPQFPSCPVGCAIGHSALRSPGCPGLLPAALPWDPPRVSPPACPSAAHELRSESPRHAPPRALPASTLRGFPPRLSLAPGAPAFGFPLRLSSPAPPAADLQVAPNPASGCAGDAGGVTPAASSGCVARASCGLLHAPAPATGSSMTPLRSELCILGEAADESSPCKGPRCFPPDPGCPLNLCPLFCSRLANYSASNSFELASSLQAESALPGSFEPSIERECAPVPIRVQL